MKLISFIEKMNELKERQDNEYNKQAHILIIMACALAFTEITQQINAVINILKSESSSSGLSYLTMINNCLSTDDKQLLVSLCEMHGTNLRIFAEALDNEPENRATEKMNSIISDVVDGFPETDFSIVERYIKNILEILKEDC